MAENEVNIVISATDKASSALKGVSGSIITLNQGLQLAQQAVRMVGEAVEATVGEYVKYADQVRKLSQLNGTSAQESSRLIQLTDDYKVSVETLNMATRKLSGQGLSLTIDSLAKMSDEYNGLGTNAEKTKFLLDKFGRSGLQMVEVMQLGGKAIKEQSATISKNLILTNQQVKAARDYQFQMDELNDTIYGFKIAMGSWALPLIMQATDAMKNGLPAWGMMGDQIKTISNLLINSGNPALAGFGVYQQKMLKLFGLDGGGIIDATSEAAIAVGKMAEAIGQTSPDVEGLNRKLQDLADLTRSISSGGDLRQLAMGLLDVKLAAGEISFEQWERLGVALGQLTPTAEDIARSMQYITDEAAKGYGDVKKWADIIAYLNSLAGSYSYNYSVNAGGGTYNPYNSNVGQNQSTRVYTTSKGVMTAAKEEMLGYASGGSASGLFWTGDSPSGLTPHSELVYAPQGAYVFNASQSRSIGNGGSPRAFMGGAMPSVSGEMNLSSSTIRQLASELANAMARFNG